MIGNVWNVDVVSEAFLNLEKKMKDDRFIRKCSKCSYAFSDDKDHSEFVDVCPLCHSVLYDTTKFKLNKKGDIIKKSI